MKRAIKTAVAVTSFGLAAALAVPAHAQAGEVGARHAYDNEPEKGRSGGGSPLGGGGPLGGLGGLLGPISGLLKGVAGSTPLGGLLGKKSAPSTRPTQSTPVKADPRRPVTTYQAPGKRQGAGPQLAPEAAGLPFSGLTGALPLGGVVPGASRMAAPRDVHVKPGATMSEQSLRGAFASVADLVEGSLSGAMAVLSTTRAVPGGTASAVDVLDGTTKALNGATEGAESLSAEYTMTGLARAARHALPQATNGRLAPLVGHLAPAETAPLLESLPGTTQVASIDEVAPLIEDASAMVATNGTKAVGTYSDTVTALGWATAALTSKVRAPWAG